MLKHLTTFAGEREIPLLKDLTTDLLREWREGWDVGPRTTLKKLERVKAFFRFATESGWIDHNPAKPLKAPIQRDSQKFPFEPAEMEAIMEAAGTIEFHTLGGGGRPEPCAALVPFILVLRHSGLRIGDASFLKPERFKGDDLYLYTKKGGTHVYVPLPPDVMKQVRSLPLIRGHYFLGPESMRIETITDLWRRKLARVFTAAGIQGGHPHRFRHYAGFRTIPGGASSDRRSARQCWGSSIPARSVTRHSLVTGS
jgi:integrase